MIDLISLSMVILLNSGVANMDSQPELVAKYSFGVADTGIHVAVASFDILTAKVDFVNATAKCIVWEAKPKGFILTSNSSAVVVNTTMVLTLLSSGRSAVRLDCIHSHQPPFSLHLGE